MGWIEIMPERDLGPDERQVVDVDGQSVLLFRHQGRVYAIASACPHMHLPLKGSKVENGTIVCPWHHSAFDIETGDVQDWSPWPPAVGCLLGALTSEKAISIFSVQLIDGQIWIRRDKDV